MADERSGGELSIGKVINDRVITKTEKGFAIDYTQEKKDKVSYIESVKEGSLNATKVVTLKEIYDNQAIIIEMLEKLL